LQSYRKGHFSKENRKKVISRTVKEGFGNGHFNETWVKKKTGVIGWDSPKLKEGDGKNMWSKAQTYVDGIKEKFT